MKIYKRVATLDSIGNVLREGSTPIFDVINIHSFEELVNLVKQENPMCSVNVYVSTTSKFITFIRDDRHHTILVCS